MAGARQPYVCAGCLVVRVGQPPGDAAAGVAL